MITKTEDTRSKTEKSRKCDTNVSMTQALHVSRADKISVFLVYYPSIVSRINVQDVQYAGFYGTFM